MHGRLRTNHMTPRWPASGSLQALLAVGLAMAALLAVGACAPLTLLNSLVPGDTFRAERDFAYGDLERQRLDVYVPASLPPAPSNPGPGAPIVVFFYGGGWTTGARADYRFAGEAFASHGYVTVIPDYRLHPAVRYADFLDDCARAVAWATRNAARLGGDPRRIYLVGHSAGAYNAAMLAYAPEYLARVGVAPESVRGFVGLAGPYDFRPLTGVATRALFGYPDTPDATQPIHYVRRDGRRLPPALLLTSSNDSVVNPGNSARLAAALRAAGSSAQEIAYAGLDHARLVGALAAPLRGFAPVLEDAIGFLAAQR